MGYTYQACIMKLHLPGEECGSTVMSVLIHTQSIQFTHNIEKYYIDVHRGSITLMFCFCAIPFFFLYRALFPGGAERLMCFFFFRWKRFPRLNISESEIFILTAVFIPTRAVYLQSCSGVSFGWYETQQEPTYKLLFPNRKHLCWRWVAVDKELLVVVNVICSDI